MKAQDLQGAKNSKHGKTSIAMPGTFYNRFSDWPNTFTTRF